jgi:hypothetical protein
MKNILVDCTYHSLAKELMNFKVIDIVVNVLFMVIKLMEGGDNII